MHRNTRKLAKYAVGILVLGRIEFGDVFRNIRLEHALILPVDQMRGVRRIDDVDRMNIGGVFLPDTLQDAFGARALDLAGDARIFGLEGLADLFRQLEVDRGVPDDLAFFLGRLDQRRRDRARRRRSRHDPGRERGAGGQRARADQHVAA